MLVPKATFICGCNSGNLPNYDGDSSVISNKDGTHTLTLPIPCCQCHRRSAKAAVEAVKASYSPQVDEWRAQIKRAEDRIWKGPLNELLIVAKDERVKAANQLEDVMRERVASVWRVFEKRWGLLCELLGMVN